MRRADSSSPRPEKKSSKSLKRLNLVKSRGGMNPSSLHNHSRTMYVKVVGKPRVGKLSGEVDK
ncbi:MAG: hypothetical protein QXH32_01670 [Candidatus Caldarchaeum sp.]